MLVLIDTKKFHLTALKSLYSKKILLSYAVP